MINEHNHGLSLRKALAYTDCSRNYFNILGESEEHFNNRLKIQKYVYLVKYYGLDMNYDYNTYLHGPYSQQLAWDYYSLAKKI